MSDLSHGPIRAGCLGELRQEVLVQGDVGIEIAEDLSELLLAHDGELQHGVVVRLHVRAEPQRSDKTQTHQPEG